MKAALLAIGLIWTGTASAHHEMTHLSFNGGAVHAHVTWETGPLFNEESIMHIEWHDGATHAPIEVPGAFEVSLFMPDMGHGSSPTVIEQVADEHGVPFPGVYRVKSMYFIMEGGWRVDVKLDIADHPSETQSFDVEIAGDGSHQHQH